MERGPVGVRISSEAEASSRNYVCRRQGLGPACQIVAAEMVTDWCSGVAADHCPVSDCFRAHEEAWEQNKLQGTGDQAISGCEQTASLAPHDATVRRNRRMAVLADLATVVVQSRCLCPSRVGGS